MFRSPVPLLALVLAVSVPVRSQADPIALTPAGIAAGFTLTTFASGFPSANNGDGFIGPLGIAFSTSGGVLVTDAFGQVYRFPADVNNQIAPAPAQNYGADRAEGLARSGGTIFMVQRDGLNRIVQLNNDGTLNQVIATGLVLPTGIDTNPANGHLFVSSIGNNKIYEIDPVSHAVSVPITARLDGITISPDGLTLYGAGVDAASQLNGHIFGYNTVTGAQVFDSGLLSELPDGTALGFGSLAGSIFANTNGGKILQINLTTHAVTVIASGGSRGDFVTVDPNDGSLLLTQSDRIVRLSAPAGGGFGSATAVPEPGTLAVVGLVGLGTLALRRRRAKA